MKTIYTLQHLLMGAALLLAASCQDTDDIATSAGTASGKDLKGTLIHFGTSLTEENGATTRATDEGFPIAGTTMTVRMTESGNTTTANYTYNSSGSWVADGEGLRWGDNSVEHTFVVVSPAQDLSATFTLPTSFTSADLESYENLLTTTAAITSYPKSNLEIPLKHALAKISVLSSSATSATLSIGTMPNTATFDLTTGALKVGETPSSAVSMAMCTIGSVHTAYVLPGTYTKTNVTYTLGDSETAKTFVFNSDTEATTVILNGGDSYICSESITLVNNTTEGGLATELANYSSVNKSRLYISGVLGSADISTLQDMKSSIVELYIDATGLETVSSSTFKEFTSLTNVILYRTQEVGQNAFIDCSKLVSIYLPNLTRFSNYGVFTRCTELKTVVAPNLTTLSAGTTFQNTGLESIYLPKLRNVYSNMFKGCTSLTKVILPSVTSATIASDSEELFPSTITTLVLGGTNAFSRTVTTGDVTTTSYLMENASTSELKNLFFTNTYSDEELNTLLSDTDFSAVNAYATFKTTVDMTEANLIVAGNYDNSYPAADSGE